MIDIDYLKKLLELFDESSVNDLKIEKEGTAIRLTKNPKKETAEGTSYHLVTPQAAQIPSVPPPTASTTGQEWTSPPAQHERTDAEEKPEEIPGASYHEIRSPIVGTFYRAPNPEAESFVEVGSEVKTGEVLCIVEAMKLMNEIESDISGRIAKILVENAQPVEYNQVLFLIEK